MAMLLKVAAGTTMVLAASALELVSFDGTSGTTFQFKELNDPVMGGKSTGTWRVDAAQHVGVFDGEVVDVPSLKAPGFIKAAADGKFPDASAATVDGDLVLLVRTKTPEYQGFRVSLASGTMAPSYACAGGGSIPLSRGCFKAKFSVPAGDNFTEVRIPFKSFSDKWSPATGEQTATCTKEADVCPTSKVLSSIKRIEVWAEGALGKIHLEVKSISAVPAPASYKAVTSDLDLVTFDGTAGTTFKFTELNDPVMGGKSTGTFSLDAAQGFGIFDGQVVDVPSLKAPGFIKAAADGHFPDVSAAAQGELVLVVRTTTPEYKGFRVSFVSGSLSPAYACSGGGSIPFSRGCFKAKFAVPDGQNFTEVRIPFTSFSDKWSPATGEQTKTCAQEPDVCPTAKTLASIKRVEVWAEGALGQIHLEVKSIAARRTSASLSKVPSSDNTCKNPIQKNLRYNISSRTEATIPVPVDPSETLAEAVCCDSRTKVYAEPQFLYQAPDINLYANLAASGPTTFYDSSCGLPLFVAPQNRTLDEFKQDTDEHGWPSFREAEVVHENVHTDSATGFVYSKCGTHLGSYLPDSKGSRWCMDLSCISGNPVKADASILI